MTHLPVLSSSTSGQRVVSPLHLLSLLLLEEGDGGGGAAPPAPPRPSPRAYLEEFATSSAVHYPTGATHYIIGEAYGPLNLDAADASMPVQKLLQLERILCLILEKEHTEVDGICDCVLGVVLIGPSIDGPTCEAVFAALSHYRTALRRLWALSEAGRLLSIRLQPLATQLQRGIQRAEAVTRAEAAATRAEVARLADATAANTAATAALAAEVRALTLGAGGGGGGRGGRGGQRGGGRGHRGGAAGRGGQRGGL